MSEKLDIRESLPADWGSIEALYPEAFPDEDLLPVVRDLLQDTAIRLSLVGVINSQIVGHVIFTTCGVADGSSESKAALLAPLAVAPAWQRQGIGRAIVHAGLRQLEDMGISLVCVLGDPNYYSRLGFVPESLVEPPYRLPAEWDGAWQSQRVGTLTIPYSGKLSVPRQWLRPALWAS
ncbi:MAG: GNAT family N-acetyltransferase [Candidatus Competibacteraceae bacterium]|jgi:putative acetyltransferase|nr:GNAT family N-acetyltransferase [Candidatus Competibacteraceae bacterium]